MMPLEAATSSARTRSQADSRLIVGLMGFTVLFSTIGAEIRVAKTPATGIGGVATGPAKILLGGVVATALLTLLSHAGDPGREFAIGLALVSMATATLVYGAPVWDSANNLFGSQPTGSTRSTKPTLAGANTAASTAILATNLAA